MNFKNKKNIIKMLSLSLVGITIAIPLSSCGYSNNAFNYDANQTPSKDFNNENNNNNNGSSNNSGILDASIVESKKVQNNSSLQQENPNDFGLTQNYLDFANNGSFNKYLGDKSIIYEDILGYLNFLYYKNNKQISFTNSNIKDLKFLEVDASNKLILNKSKISFELVVTVSTNELSEFVIGDKKFNLAKDHSSTLIIKSVDQTLKPTIEKQGEKFYLGWFLDKVSVSFNNQDFEILNFKPTANSFSKAFYFSFNNLSDKQSYFDLKEKYQKDFENQISNESVKKDLEEKINSETALYFDYMDIANNLINEIATDQPVNYLVQKASVYLIDIVTKIGIIPQGIDAILKEAIKIDGSNKSLTLLEVIVNNKEKILSILKSYLGSAYDIVEPLLINLQINMKEDNPSYKLLLEYVNQFVGKDDPIRKLITGDILGVTSSAKSLFDIVWSNIETILNKIKEATQNDKTLTSLINLLTIIFTKDSTSNQFVSIYDSLFKSKETKQKFINSIVSLLPANISEYLNILIIDNSAVNKELMLKITKSFANFFKGLYEHKSDADDTTSFDQRYKNLSFTKTWVTSPTVTKKDVITTTFNYEIKASIINAVDLDIKPI
nr:hypothetical protein [Malacoplasma penetrans]